MPDNSRNIPNAIRVVNELISKQQGLDDRIKRILPRIALTLEKQKKEAITLRELEAHLEKGEEHLKSLYSEFRAVAVSSRASPERTHQSIQARFLKKRQAILKACRKRDFDQITKYYRQFGATVFDDDLIEQVNDIFLKEKTYSDIFQFLSIFSQDLNDCFIQIRDAFIFAMDDNSRDDFLSALKSFYNSEDDDANNSLQYNRFIEVMFYHALSCGEKPELTLSLLGKMDEVNLVQVLLCYLSGQEFTKSKNDISFHEAAKLFNKNYERVLFEIIFKYTSLDEPDYWHGEGEGFDIIAVAFLSGNINSLVSYVMALEMMNSMENNNSHYNPEKTYHLMRIFSQDVLWSLIVSGNIENYPSHIIESSLEGLSDKARYAGYFSTRIMEEAKNPDNQLHKLFKRPISSKVMAFMLKNIEVKGFKKTFDEQFKTVFEKMKVQGEAGQYSHLSSDDPAFSESVMRSVVERYTDEISQFIYTYEQYNACRENVFFSNNDLLGAKFPNVLATAGKDGIEELFSVLDQDGNKVLEPRITTDFLEEANKCFQSEQSPDLDRNEFLDFVNQKIQESEIIADDVKAASQKTLDDFKKLYKRLVGPEEALAKDVKRSPLIENIPDTIDGVLGKFVPEDVWISQTGEKAPQGLEKFASPFLFKKEAYYEILDIIVKEDMSTFEYDEMRNNIPELAPYAYSVAAIFQTKDKFLEYVDRHGKPTATPFLDCAKDILITSDQYVDFDYRVRVNYASWRDALMQIGPKFAKFLPHIVLLETPVRNDQGTRWSYEKTKKAIAPKIFAAREGMQDLAEIFFEYKIDPTLFNKVSNNVLLVRAAKKVDLIPDIEIDGDEFELKGARFYKLPIGDVRGLFLGLYTDNCQSITSNGALAAYHGFMSSYGGFYVVEKDNQILGMSWAWLSEDGQLVFDSLEQLGSRVSSDQWQLILDKFGDKIDQYNDAIQEMHIDLSGVMEYEVAKTSMKRTSLNGQEDVKKKTQIHEVLVGQGGATSPLPYEKTSMTLKGIDITPIDSKKQYRVWRQKKTKGSQVNMA